MSVSGWDKKFTDSPTRLAPIYGTVKCPVGTPNNDGDSAQYINNISVDITTTKPTYPNDSHVQNHQNIRFQQSDQLVSDQSRLKFIADETNVSPTPDNCDSTYDDLTDDEPSHRRPVMAEEDTIYETITSPVDWLHEAGLEKYIKDFKRIDCMDVSLFKEVRRTP